jgi:hypothetical protein|tara:strand:- start:339 stop:569 length:231 start_codon:yes stop_codon:yes gene_type:complete
MSSNESNTTDTGIAEDISDSVMANIDDDTVDAIEDTIPQLRDQARLCARRRRIEDLLEARRLREELGDDDFSFNLD